MVVVLHKFIKYLVEHDALFADYWPLNVINILTVIRVKFMQLKVDAVCSCGLGV